MKTKHVHTPENYLFVLVNLTIFLDSVLYGIIVPVVPHYATALGASPAQVGVIFAAYSAGLLLFDIPAGIACDRYGYKPPLVLGMAGLTLATVAFAFSGRIWLLAASRLAQGIAGAVTWTAAMAVVAALYPSRRLGQRMGIMMTSGGIGTIIGPALGGAFYCRLRRPFSGCGSGGYRAGGAPLVQPDARNINPRNKITPGAETFSWEQV